MEQKNETFDLQFERVDLMQNEQRQLFYKESMEME
jgi:hypothetical protein